MAKHLFITFITLCLLFLVSCGKKRSAPIENKPDSIYTLDYAYEIAPKDGKLAWKIIDSVERREIASGYRSEPNYKFNFTKGYVASRQLRPYQAIGYLLRALNEDSVQQNAPMYMRVTSLLANEYMTQGRTDECLMYLKLFTDKSLQSNDMYAYAKARYSLAVTYMNNDEPRKALEELPEIRQLFRKYGAKKDTLTVLETYYTESICHALNGNTEEAIRLCHYLLSRYQNLAPEERTGTIIEKQDDLNFRLAEISIQLACFYEEAHQADSATTYYKQWKSYVPEAQKVLSSQFYGLVMEFYKKRRQYAEALQYTDKYEKQFSSADTISSFHLELKREKSEIFFLMGDYKQALQNEQEANAITASLMSRSNSAIAIEMAAIYNVAEKQEQILKQKIALSRRNIYIASLALTLIGLFIVAFIVWKNFRRTKAKNKILFSQIAELRAAKKELDKLHKATQSPLTRETASHNTNELAQQFEQYIKENARYLQKDITRDNVVAALRTNRTYLSSVIKESFDMSFVEYVNGLRLEYAKEAMFNDTETKIEAIALSSGFNSTRTFYRLFMDKYGVTPNEFRRMVMMEEG